MRPFPDAAQDYPGPPGGSTGVRAVAFSCLVRPCPDRPNCVSSRAPPGDRAHVAPLPLPPGPGGFQAVLFPSAAGVGKHLAIWLDRLPAGAVRKVGEETWIA